MTIDRLTPEDQVMLWPDAMWPQDIGAVALLDPNGFSLERVRRVVESRLHLVPRFRQRLHEPDKRFGRPLWIDDPAFDLGRHVGVVQIPPPGDEPQLLAAVEELRRRRLDRNRPLWEMWFLTGMRDGRIGMFARTHHSVADGIAGVATLGAFLDLEPCLAPAAPPPWLPLPAPSEAELLADEAQGRGDQSRMRLLALAHPVTTARHALAALPAMRELFAEPALPPTSLDCLVGAGRAYGIVRGRLDAVKDVAHESGGKVNDVLLTVIAGGLRGLLLSRGEAVEGLVMRIYVPVSLRQGQYAGARGNRISQMAVPLPVWEPDPRRRLRLIRAETARRKARARPSVGALPFTGIAGRLALKLVQRQRVNVESADLPGPPVPMYLAGTRILELFPLLPLIGRVSLGVGALSYAGQLNLGVVADKDGYPDLEVFCASMHEGLHTLGIEAAARSEPARMAVSG